MALRILLLAVLTLPALVPVDALGTASPRTPTAETSGFCKLKQWRTSCPRGRRNGDNFSRRTLGLADFSHAWLEGATFYKTNLSGSNFSRSHLRNANLSNGDRTKGNWRHADLRGANLWHADFYGTDLLGADLRGAYGQVKLDAANLTDANLEGAHLRNWGRSKATPCNTRLPNGRLVRPWCGSGKGPDRRGRIEEPTRNDDYEDDDADSGYGLIFCPRDCVVEIFISYPGDEPSEDEGFRGSVDGDKRTPAR